MSSSKLKHCFELCRFAQALLEIKLQDGNRIPSWEISMEVPIVTFLRMDGILLEIRNRKERCCDCSLVATTSHISTLGSSPFQVLTHIGIVGLFLSPYLTT
jgi:hypothetical protein